MSNLMWASALVVVLASGFALGCGDGSAPSADTPVSGDPAGSPVAAAQGVAGRVTSTDGGAVEGAFVQASSLDPDGPAIPEIAIFTDADGNYQWTLRPGRYELAITADGFERAVDQVTVASGELAKLDFVLRPTR